MNKQEIQARINWLLDELAPLSYHSDILISPHAYIPESDTIYLNVVPKSPAKWAETAYSFCQDNDFKYDRSHRLYGIDGQPRVSSDGFVWVRYIWDFLDGSKVGMNIWSQQPSHSAAECELGNYYRLWQCEHGMEPVDVLRKFLARH